MISDQISDQRERDSCLDVARSFVVQAPAGSGKTELLVQRFLRLLAAVKRPEEVVAITFTKKAAAEMRRRVLERVPNPQEVAHRLRIETIDAFCLSLARQLPVPAEFGVPPGIAEDPKPLYREAAAGTLALVEQADYVKEVGRLLAHLDNDVEAATRLLADMLAKRDQWLRTTGFAPTRKELEASLQGVRDNMLSHASGIDARFSEAFALEALTKNGDWRKKAPAPELVGSEHFREVLWALCQMPPGCYSDAQWETLAAILAVLPTAAAELKLVFAARGEADFTEIAQGAVRALGSAENPSDLLLKLDQSISHMLVDEFQDTSISQWELLDRLTSGWSPGDGRTLFLVGDPMQSIYRFREARVGLFLQARRQGLRNVKLEPVALKTNFRSQEGLVEWFNQTFKSVFPRDEDETAGAVPYSAAVAHPENPALPGDAARWHASEDRVAEAALVVELVKQAEGTRAILVRSRNSLAEIVPALKAAGLRFRAIEIDKLGERQVVQDLFALTRALTHLADRVAWLAILRAPWVGLSLEELLLVSPADAGAHTVWEGMQKFPGLDRFRSVVGEALANRLRGTLRDRVESVWLALGGPACVAERSDLEDAEAYLDALEALEAGGEVDFARLEELLLELHAQPDAEARDEDVQIMTIHKAKGLEFGTVIVPGLDAVPFSGYAPLLRWQEVPTPSSSRKRGPSLLLAPIRPAGEDKEPAYEYIRRLERDAEDTEAARLLYVAATRAERRLHLIACPRKNMPPKRSLLARAWPVAAPLYEGLVPPPSREDEAVVLDPLVRRLPGGWKLPAPPAAVAWQAPAEGREEQQIEFSWAGETARHVGSVVHRWLQRIGDDELQGWDAKRIDALRPRLNQELRRRGVQGAAAVAVVVAALKNCVADERGRWLLGPGAEAKSEYRLRTAAGTLIVDRVLTDKEGRRWVVDFKTSRHEGANVEAFLDQEQKRYAAQLDAYAEAVGGARRGLYFPLLKNWRDW